MGVRLLFVTGARSEYGLARGLLSRLADDPVVDLGILPHGMHLEERFGSSVREIRRDGFPIVEEVVTGTASEKSQEFTRTIERIQASLGRHRPEAVLIIGDRLEAYGAALAAHFAGIPIIHSGGGHLTTGAVDNIYRFNISNLAALHLVSSAGAFERLRRSPLIEVNRVHLVGSVTVDQILSFQAEPRSIAAFAPGIRRDRFAVMTFHPATYAAEPIAELAQMTVDGILSQDYDLLCTYPNNDRGSDEIIHVLERNRGRTGFHLFENLGYEGYLAALNECRFVVGNSSSGLMEAPYFGKPVLNVGSRQDGREKDVGIRDVPAEPVTFGRALEEGFQEGWPAVGCSMLYGDGRSVDRAHRLIREFLQESKAGTELVRVS